MSRTPVKLDVVIRTRSQVKQGDEQLRRGSEKDSDQSGVLPEVDARREEASSEEDGAPSTDTVDSEEDEQEGEVMTENRGLAIVPGRFRGGIEESVEEYLIQFERIARANGWNENKKKVILPCYLEGAALKYYENLERTVGEEITWAQIKNGLKVTFQGIAQEEQLEVKLRLRMQGEMEPVEAYVQDVLNLCHKIDNEMVERSQIKHVLRGLKPSLLEKVMLMENNTLENLIMNIRKIETARYMAGQRVDRLMTEPVGVTLGGSSSSTGMQASTSTLETKLEQLTSEFAKLGMRLLEQQQPVSRAYRGNEQSVPDRGQQWKEGSQRGNRPAWNRGRGAYREPGRGRTADGRVICYKCNRPGHYAIACRSTVQGNGEGGR